METMKLEGLCSQTEAWLFYYGWSRVYDRMQPFFTSNEMREAGLDLANLNGPLKILDVGAGTGTLSLQVAKRCGAERLTLLDQSAQMLNQAKAKLPLAPCEFVLSDAQTLPFDNDSFDRVVSSGSFYYFPDPVAALREQLRVVRPGGCVLVMGSLQPKPLFIRFFAQMFNRFPTEEQYHAWFAEAGLTDVKAIHVSNPWNAKQYAIAICGVKAPGTANPPRNLPLPDTPTTRLHRLAKLPLVLARFGLALGAFFVIGPLQVATAAIGMHRLKAAQATS
jgi:MPBQ/MSBQ methyltransferase